MEEGVMKGLLYVHRKTAKGREYYYFNTGQREDGRAILTPLPHVRDPSFAAKYQSALANRTRREKVEHARNFDWLCRIYEQSPEFKVKAEGTKRLYVRHLGYAAENFRSGEGRSWPLDMITGEYIVALRDKYAHQVGTANIIVKSVSALLTWASTKGRSYIKSNPAIGIEMLETGEHEPWPDELVDLALVDEAMRLPVALLYFTGQRIGDVVRMGRGHIKRGAIEITQQKTGIELRIPIHRDLAAIIEADAPKDAIAFLMGERKRPLTDGGLRQRVKKWAKEQGHHVVPHGLRKNAVNALLEAGCSTAEVSAITGQSLAMIEHYAKRRDREKLGRSAILKFERNK